MKQKPFIPSWLDEAGLSATEMRVFIHLCRCADNQTGIAWPSYRRMTEITGLSKNTIRRAIERLEAPLKLIAKTGKPFAGSCRYRVLPIVPPEGQMDDSNSPTTGTNGSAPIVPPVTHNSPSHGTSIVPPEGQEGNPLKVIQRRLSNRENSPEGIQFAVWFKSSLPIEEQERMTKNWLNTFCETFDKLVRIDKRTPEQIREVSRWGRTDHFWQTNFKSPVKLRQRDKAGTLYFDVFSGRMKQPSIQPSKPPTTVNLGRRTASTNHQP
jgi:hypothetical protein